MPKLIEALKKSDVPPGMGKTVQLGSVTVAIFNVRGKFYAVDNACPHRGGPLGEGSLHGTEVSCPWHGWQFDLATGRSFQDPQFRLKRYPVQVKGDAVLISI